jgi:ATP-dependent helicase/nuclease subunit B
MPSRPLRVFTIAPDQPFLEVLARAVLAGFPREDASPPDPLNELPRWTILLPTRRAVRQLESHLQNMAPGRGSLLPRIRPIGDIDEDMLQDDDPEGDRSGLPPAITAVGRDLLLIGLIDQWAAENPQLPLAAEIADAPARAQALAASLGEFIDGLETEDVDGSHIRALFDHEFARHREAILSFLTIAQRQLPERLLQLNLMGRKARQPRVLLHEARRLSETAPRWPIIAAGSTGSIPATRALLKAIAGLPHGAVVLPGLDQATDEESWTALGPQHPQFVLKQLLADFGLARAAVRALGDGRPAPRQYLARQVMRPPETSHLWRDEVPRQREALSQGFDRLTLVEATDRSEESLVIALMLREVLETPGRTASLITPDRDLARRVKHDLRRWAIDIDDSAGEPLIKSGGAGFAGLLLDAIEAGFSAETLNALFQHPLCRVDLPAETVRQAVQVIELSLFRRGAGVAPPAAMAAALRRARAEIAADRHAHPAFAALGDGDWEAAEEFLGRAGLHLAACGNATVQPFARHLQTIIACLEAMAGADLYGGEDGEAFRSLLAVITAETHHAMACGMNRVTAFLRRQLTLTPYRPQRGLAPRLAILGLLEARLMRADVHVLGGLNEGVWPALPDSGPWLNRPMRETIGLSLPERSIGQMAHDFVQALGAPEVRLVWSRRIGDSPAIPSRWVMRLRMLEKRIRPAADVPRWLAWARAMDTRTKGRASEKPQPQPPLAMRPRRLSVTQIETLIRDPYAIYGRQVLRLEPLDSVSSLPSPALRGTVFHAAIGDFLTRYPDTLPDDPFTELLACAEPHFLAHREQPLVMALWWPRFIAIARWFADAERAARPQLVRVHAEIGAALTLDTPAGPFRLTGRADRIDLRRDGTAAIIDYKTGAVASGDQIKAGLAPQLPLEAAMLARGGFAGLGPMPVSAVLHVKLSGGTPAGEMIVPDFKGETTASVAEQALAGLQRLLAGYANPLQPYLPRTAAERDDEALSHDHLSRYREWILASDRS